jgi:hypothetical protein
MSTELKATFDIAGWDEHAFDVRKGAAKMTHYKVKKVFHGDVDGESTLVYLMVYAPNGTAAFVGLERSGRRSPAEPVRSWSNTSARSPTARLGPSSRSSTVRARAS